MQMDVDEKESTLKQCEHVHIHSKFAAAARRIYGSATYGQCGWCVCVYALLFVLHYYRFVCYCNDVLPIPMYVVPFVKTK